MKVSVITNLITIGLLCWSCLALRAQESRPSTNTSTGFFIKNGKLYDGNGCEFVPRGVNNGHVWHDKSPGSGKAYDALDNIAGLGFNAVRVVWGIHQWRNDDGSFGPLSDDNVLRSVIERCIELQMIPMVELHDYTGTNNTANVTAAAQWWADRASLISDYEEHLIINVLNEWGGGGVEDTQWRDAYTNAISIIREADIKVPLIIDGSLYAKNFSPIRLYGKEVLDSDPLKSVGFGVHYYCGSGENDQAIEEELGWGVDNNVLLLVGEFAQDHYRYAEPRGTICDVRERFIVAETQRNGQGHFWWAWNSRGTEGVVNFSLGDFWEASNRSELTDIGEWLILDDPNGIQATSEVAGVFSGVCSTPPSPEPPTGGDCQLTITASGTTGNEQMELLVDDAVADTWTVTTRAADYTATIPTSSNVKVRFSNNGLDAEGNDMNLIVDAISAGGTTYQAEEQTTNTGAWNVEESRCGGIMSETLHCTGYVDFGTVACASDGEGGNLGQIIIRAKGECGSENMELRIDGSPVANWTVAADFVPYSYDEFSGGEVSVHFTNNNDVVSGCEDKNLEVDWISVCGTTYETETEATETADCCLETKDKLYTNGNFNFGTQSCGSNSRSSRSLKPTGDALLDAVKVYPNPATRTLTVTGEEDYQLALYDMKGREVLHRDHLRGTTTLDVADVRPGLYLIKLRDAQARQIERKIIIQ